MYDKDILQEESILGWAAEKEEAEESDKIFLKQSEKFIQVRFLQSFCFCNCHLISFSGTNIHMLVGA